MAPDSNENIIIQNFDYVEVIYVLEGHIYDYQCFLNQLYFTNRNSTGEMFYFPLDKIKYL